MQQGPSPSVQIWARHEGLTAGSLSSLPLTQTLDATAALQALLGAGPDPLPALPPALSIAQPPTPRRLARRAGTVLAGRKLEEPENSPVALPTLHPLASD